MKMLKEFFTWSKGERRAVILLSLLLLLLFSGDIFFNRINPFDSKSIHPDTLAIYNQLLEELEKDISIEYKEGQKKPAKSIVEGKEKKKIHTIFDPNDLDLIAWTKLGFSVKQGESLLKYKASLGSFKTKEDLANSYVVSESKFAELKPFIKIKAKNISENLEKDELDYNEDKKVVLPNEEVFLEINSADSISLLQLKGIGPFYAGKIIEYRKELGAFVEKEQLLEIWNFDTLKLQSIEEFIWIDRSYRSKINVNSDSSHVLKRHPYINWNVANAIVNYRNQHGQFTIIEDLKEIVLINDSLFLKLYPYISID